MPQHTHHDAGVGADIAQQDQGPNHRHSIGLLVVTPREGFRKLMDLRAK